MVDTDTNLLKLWYLEPDESLVVPDRLQGLSLLLPEESPPLDAPSPSDDDANEEEATDEDLLAIGQRSRERGEHQDKGTK